MAKQIKKASVNAGVNRVKAAFTTTDHGHGMPYLDLRPQFVFVFNPRRWTVLAGKLIPALHVMPLESGVNGVLTARDGSIRFATARARIEEQGRTLIPYEWGPDGESYMQSIRTRPRGGKNEMDTYLTVWEQGGAGDSETYTDDDAYAAWAASLVEDGKVPACPAPLARRMLEQVEQKIARENALVEKGGQGSGAAGIRAKALEGVSKALAAAAKPTGARVSGSAASVDLGGA